MLLRLIHTKPQENTTNKSSFKKGFTLVELIISISIGATLILGTYSVLSQSLATIHESIVAGTMDNYAYSIQSKIKSELISAKYINLASNNHSSNLIDSSISGNQGYNYKNLYYANENNLNYGIIYHESEKRISVVFYPELNRYLPPSQQEFREISSIFSEAGADGVLISDFKWNIDTYTTNIDIYTNPDYISTPAKMVKYQFTLTKNYTSGKVPLKKTYYFTEVLECAI